MCVRGRGGIRKRSLSPLHGNFYLSIHISSLSLSLFLNLRFFRASHCVFKKNPLSSVWGLKPQKIYISKMCGGAGMCERGRGRRGGLEKDSLFPLFTVIISISHTHSSLSPSLSLNWRFFFEESHCIFKTNKKTFPPFGVWKPQKKYISKMCGGAGMCVREGEGGGGGSLEKDLFSLLH